MSWPEINLDAVCRTAAALLSCKCPAGGAGEVERYHAELRAAFDELNAGISGINAQLAARNRPEDAEWRGRAKRARDHYIRQGSALKQQLKTARSILLSMSMKAMAEDAHANRMERIRAHNDRRVQWCEAFGRVCKRELGNEAYLRLCEITRRELDQNG